VLSSSTHLAFNAGLSSIFLILGTTAGLVGSAITSNPWVRIIGGIVIILFGLQLIGLLKISTLYKDTRFFSSDKPRGILGSALLEWPSPQGGLHVLVQSSAASSAWRAQWWLA
jgi:cytochrome c-type biogenesis protein